MEKVLSDHKSINNNEELEKELNQIKRDYELLKFENKRLESENRASFSLKYKMTEFEENLKAKSRDSLVIESEYRKEFALLRQKLEFHEKTIEEMSKKANNHQQELKNIKSAHYTEIKELTLKYETLNKSLEMEVKHMRDRTQDLQSELDASAMKLIKEHDNSQLAEAHFKKIIQEGNENMKELRNEVQQLRNKDLEKSEKMKDFHERNLEDLNETLKTVEENYRVKEKAYKELKLAYEKDKAVLSQKIEFLEMELKEIKDKKIETSSIQDVFLKALELSQDYTKNPKSEEIHERMKQEIKRLEEDIKNLKVMNNLKEKEIEELRRFSTKDHEETKKMQNQITELRVNNERFRLESKDSQVLYTSELEKILILKDAIESNYTDLKTKYTKEQAIWAEQIHNLTDELQDSERKFHLALKHKDDSFLESIEHKQFNDISTFYETKTMTENKRKSSFLENCNKESKKRTQCISTLTSLNSLNLTEIRPKTNNNQIFNQELIDLEKESYKNRIYELEQALNDSEARREIQRNELKREKSKQNLTIHENPKQETKTLRRSINIYNTLQNPLTTPKGPNFVCLSKNSNSPNLKGKKAGLHSKNPSYSENTFLFNNRNEGNAQSLNDLRINSQKNVNKSFLLNQNSSLEDHSLFELKRKK